MPHLNEKRSPTSRISWTDYRGCKQSRVINHCIDVRDFEGTAGFVWLVMAANKHLSVSDIQTYLETTKLPHVERPSSWFYKRRKLFIKPGERTARGAKANADGRDADARRIMLQHPKMSARDLSRTLKDLGIPRGKDWIQWNRCRAV